MIRKHFVVSITIVTGIFAMAFPYGTRAQNPIDDDFTQAVNPLPSQPSSNNWQAFGGACLTAGSGGTSTIPACVGLPYYQGQIQVGGNNGYLGTGLSTPPSSGGAQKPDPVGQGALRFTNGWISGPKNFSSGFTQFGGVISGNTFGTGAGVQVIFKTVTYEGDSGGSGNDGADGMSFFLLDGSAKIYDTGAFGGSLGYTCSNTNNDTKLHPDGTPRQFDGVAHGYLGLGMDEFGNFLNQTDNTATGFGLQAGRIGLRGAGNITWAQLNALNSTYYPGSLNNDQRASAVQNTCKTGFLWDYSNASNPDQTATPVADYAPIYGSNGVGAYTILSGFNIANEAATTRGDAMPLTYNLKITQNGLLSLSYSYNGGNFTPIISKQDITNSNGAVPGSFRFGFTGSTGGNTNVHEILCFQATPVDLAGSSVGVNEKQATKIASGTQAFLAYYYPSNWTGRLTASDLKYDTASQTLFIASTANWDASCNLTGIAAGTTNACPTTKVVGPVLAQAPASRTMLTWDGVKGVGEAFEWSSGTNPITTAQQNTLDSGDLPLPYNAKRLNYLRGDRSNEITALGVGIFRGRDGVLGDIIDSSPTWVGPPTSPYAATWKDLLPSATDPITENSGTQTFTQFLTAAQTRLNVVYNGANDGFLHGFEAGSFDANGSFVNNSTTPNDGKEVLAYMPGAVLQTIHNSADPTLDYSNPQYAHNFYVDATPDVDDLFYNGKWHSWLVGGLGAGGAAIYILDVTDPTQFSEGNAKSVVLGEWTSSTITCVGNSTCGTNMGNTYGVPVVRRLHDGNWAVIFGNGYGSKSGDAGIFIMIVNPTSGAIASTYYLSTGKIGKNGIAYVAPMDLDGDHITDYVYAGDLLGNVWRFDLTSSNESSWAASSTPLFTVPSGQPITTKLLVAITPQSGGLSRVMVDFGTGRKIPQTNTASASFAKGAQKLYGIWDWNMTKWNSLSPIQFASFTGSPTINDSTLQTQTLIPTNGYSYTDPQSGGWLDISSNPVCWAGSATCTGGPASNTQFGFEVALGGTDEQLIFNPLLYQNALIVNTTIPAVNAITSCSIATDTGNTISISVSTGGSLATSVGGKSKGFYTQITDSNAAGDLTNGTGTPFVVLAGGNAFVLTQSLGNGSQTGPVKCPPGALYCTGQISQGGATGKRLTWVQRR
jgi:type IV pilus assembly protein PilY1